MHGNLLEIIILLFLAISLIAILANRSNFPQPIAFLLGGILLALLPGMENIQVPPNLMLMLFLPPLLMEAAYFTSIRDFRRQLKPILQLAIGLVLFSSLAIAVTMKLILPDAGWALGFVMGAIISPPDAVAATSVIKKMRVPKRVVTVLEGESLINDATGLVIYKFAVAAVVTGAFSWGQATGEFLWMALSGLTIGMATAWVYMRIFPILRDSSVETLTTFIVPYIVYIMAELLHGSGVLAVVSAGLVVGWMGPETFSTNFRLTSEAVWKTVVFILNGLVFLLIGLQFPDILTKLAYYSPWTLLGYVLAICLVTVLVRLLYVFTIAYGLPKLFPSFYDKPPYTSWQNVFVVAWVGMRGVVSLATALALPFTLSDGTMFPHRDLIIFLAVSVIFFTLVVQGLSLPLLLRKMTLAYNPEILFEDWQARKTAAEAALSQIEKLSMDDQMQTAALKRICGHYRDRIESLGDGPNTPLHPTEVPNATNHPILIAENTIWQQVIEIERRAVIDMRKSFTISDDVMHDILRELDLLSTRFQVNGKAA